MRALSKLGDLSTGHENYPPTQMITTPVVKTYINGKLAGVVDPSCTFATHSKGSSVHPSNTRYPTRSSGKLYIEGYLAAWIGDPLADGDEIGEGSMNSFAN